MEKNAMSTMGATQAKRLLFKIYNEVNREVYGYGVTELKINFIDNMLIFMSKDNRVHILEILEERYSLLKQNVDQALFTELKIRLKNSLRKNLNLETVSMHRDYDSGSRTAITVVVLDEAAFKALLDR